MHRSLILLAAIATTTHAQTVPSFDRAAFASDFTVAVQTLRQHHPKLQLIQPRAAFDSIVRQAESNLPTATRERSILELMRVVASLEDGHTGFELASLSLRRYPIELSVFDDGMFVTRSGPASAKALGWRIARIGKVPIDTLIARVRPYLTADNEPGRRQSLPPRLTTHELLELAGAADARGAWFISVNDSVFLPRPDAGATALTHSARDTTRPAAGYLVNRARRFWWQKVEAGVHSSIMYAQLNTLARDPAVPFADQVDSLFREIAAEGVSTLILDIRNNQGGDGTLSRALIHRIIQTPSINQRGHLFVITGRATFSAAVILAAALENETNATFVGEPTGAPANHYGEPARMELPATKIRFSYSRLYWQNGDPRDRRTWIAPSIPVGLTFAEWRDNRDPALATILAIHGAPGRAMPKLRVAGDYSTSVALLADGCGGSGVANNTTTIEHTPGEAAIAVLHAGNRYEGTIRPNGTFSTARKTLTIDGTAYDIGIVGEFTGDGLRAYVTVNVRAPDRAACQYTAGWNGLRTAGLNMIPGG